MRSEPNVKIERYRFMGPMNCNVGSFIVPHGTALLRVICSNGGGWDHVSISLQGRCPTWAEMCAIKELFFRDDEPVMQLHPEKSEWINNHPFCLHLWRPQSTEEITEIRQQWGDEWPADYPCESVGKIPLPPDIFVGIRGLLEIA